MLSAEIENLLIKCLNSTLHRRGWGHRAKDDGRDDGKYANAL